jgi:hypothetical protein
MFLKSHANIWKFNFSFTYANLHIEPSLKELKDYDVTHYVPALSFKQRFA